MGAAVPGRWQLWQDRWSKGSTSFVNVGASASVAAATGAGLPMTHASARRPTTVMTRFTTASGMSPGSCERAGPDWTSKIGHGQHSVRCRRRATGFAPGPVGSLRGQHADHTAPRASKRPRAPSPTRSSIGSPPRSPCPSSASASTCRDRADWVPESPDRRALKRAASGRAPGTDSAPIQP